MGRPKKPRAFRNNDMMRGPTTFQRRTPVRRISIEISEGTWSRLKRRALETSIPMNQLLEQASAAMFGVDSEAEICQMYAAMSGELEPELEPVVAPELSYTFATSTVCTVLTKSASAAILKPETIKPIVQKTTGKKDEFGSGKPYVRPETVALTREILGI